MEVNAGFGRDVAKFNMKRIGIGRRAPRGRRTLLGDLAGRCGAKRGAEDGGVEIKSTYKYDNRDYESEAPKGPGCGNHACEDSSRLKKNSRQRGRSSESKHGRRMFIEHAEPVEKNLATLVLS